MNKSSKRQSFSFFNTGTTSLLLIFLVLCLVTFSVLSLTTAQADLRMSRKTAERTQLYYTASNTAQQILAQIDGTLAGLYRDSLNAQEYANAVQDYPWDCLDCAAAVSCTDTALEYEVPMTERQTLHVTVIPCFPASESDGFYRIETWSIIGPDDWEADTALPVYTAP